MQFHVKRYKWLIWIPVGVIALILLILSVASWVLTSERLTRLINRYGTEYLQDGRVRATGANLTWWSSFPRLEISVDSLSVTSLAEGVPDSVRCFASLERLEATVSIPAICIGRISLLDAQIVHPRITVWRDSMISNLDIFPTSNPDDNKEKKPLSLPRISINHFAIVGDAPIRYISMPDSTLLQLNIRRIAMDDKKPHYQFVTESNGSASFIPVPDGLPIGVDGKLMWDSRKPLQIVVKDFQILAGEIELEIDAQVDATDAVEIEEFSFKSNEISPGYLAQLARSIPSMSSLPAFSTDCRLLVKGNLLSPWVLDSVPHAQAFLDLTEGSFRIPDYDLDLRDLSLKALVCTDGHCLDSTKVEISRIGISGANSAFGVDLSGVVTSLFTNPKISGQIITGADLARLPAAIYKMTGMNLRGQLEAEAHFDCYASDLTVNTFHRIKARGRAIANNLSVSMPADTISFWSRRAEVHLGTSQSFVGRGNRHVDSLLTLSMKVDTASLITPGVNMSLRNLALGAGCRGDMSLADTTAITPMGGRLSLDALRVSSEMGADSMRASLRQLTGSLALRRFEGNKRVPQLDFSLHSGRAFGKFAAMRMSMRNTDVGLTMHINPTKKRVAPRRTEHRRLSQHTREHDLIDFGVDRNTSSLLRRLTLQGSVTSKSGMIFTPAYPARIRLGNLNLAFTADSVALNSMSIKTGQSDLNLNGQITNIRKAIRPHSSSPLGMKLILDADTLNINELVQTAMRGAALAAKSDSLIINSADEIADDVLANVDSADVAEMTAVLVPINVDATVYFKADNILYSNVWMRNSAGELTVRDGAVTLSDLRAYTDMGAACLDAFYYAPTKHDIQAALSLQLARFRIDRVRDILPSLDSIMPILADFKGVVDMSLGATARVDSAMNVDIPSVRAMLNLSGDSLTVLDSRTFRTISKWLLFKDKNKNMIDHMDVDLSIDNSTLRLYPFMFDFDRYRLGVMGHNDLNLNLNYHVSVLRSPIPFKFGINLSGNPDKMKVRLGRARVRDKNVMAHKTMLTDSIRVNLVQEMRSILSRSAKAAKIGPLKIASHEAADSAMLDLTADTISAADSLYFKNNGLDL